MTKMRMKMMTKMATTLLVQPNKTVAAVVIRMMRRQGLVAVAVPAEVALPMNLTPSYKATVGVVVVVGPGVVVTAFNLKTQTPLLLLPPPLAKVAAARGGAAWTGRAAMAGAAVEKRKIEPPPRVSIRASSSGS
jgi:hypothetical protein